MTTYLLVALSGQTYAPRHDLQFGSLTPALDISCPSRGADGACQLGNVRHDINGSLSSTTIPNEINAFGWDLGYLCVAIVIDMMISACVIVWLARLLRVPTSKEIAPIQAEVLDDNGDNIVTQQLFEFLGIPEDECSGMLIDERLEQRGAQGDTKSDVRDYCKARTDGSQSTCAARSTLEGDSSNVQDLFDFLALDEVEPDNGHCSCDGHIFEPCPIGGVNRCNRCDAFLFSQWGCNARGPCDRGFFCQACSVVFCSACVHHSSQRVSFERRGIISTTPKDLASDIGKEETRNPQEQVVGFDSLEFDRFRRARPKSEEDAMKMYKSHLQWRTRQGSPDNLLKGAQAIPKSYVRLHGRALDGSPILLVQGARYDTSVNPEFYVLALAHALDSAFGRSSNEKLTIVIDTRPRKGWPNPLAPRMVPFFKQCVAVLPDNYPERVQRVIIFPLPSIFAALWRMVQTLLDPVTAEKFVVFGGSATSCPKGIYDYFDADQIPT